MLSFTLVPLVSWIHWNAQTNFFTLSVWSSDNWYRSLVQVRAMTILRLRNSMGQTSLFVRCKWRIYFTKEIVSTIRWDCQETGRHRWKMWSPQLNDTKFELTLIIIICYFQHCEWENNCWSHQCTNENVWKAFDFKQNFLDKMLFNVKMVDCSPIDKQLKTSILCRTNCVPLTLSSMMRQ